MHKYHANKVIIAFVEIGFKRLAGGFEISTQFLSLLNVRVDDVEYTREPFLQASGVCNSDAIIMRRNCLPSFTLFLLKENSPTVISPISGRLWRSVFDQLQSRQIDAVVT